MKKILLFTSTLFILPLVSFAQGKITPLINIPGLTDAGGGGFSVYINFLYAASISIAALLAVIKIIIAGVKYMLTDVISTKSNAKGEIQGALLGLLLILGAYIILYIINPRLVNPTVQFQKIPDTPAGAASGGSSISTPGGTSANAAPATVQQKQLLPPLDLSEARTNPTPENRAAASAAFSKFRTDCTAAGGSVTLNSTNPNLRNCQLTVKTPTPTPSGNPTPPTNPDFLFAPLLIAGSGAAGGAYQAQCQGAKGRSGEENGYFTCTKI